MIVRVVGVLSEVSDESVVVESGDVAREVLVPRFSIGELEAHRGRKVTLHTLEFFEGNQASGNIVPRMIGFLHPEDRMFFERFVAVKGMGSRKALKALSQPVRSVATWIESGDTDKLASLAGIGPRAAQMIVATLSGKMDDLVVPEAMEEASLDAGMEPEQRDALEVLVAWGDARVDAQQWLQRAMQLHPEPRAADDWVRLAYRVKSGTDG